MVQAEVIMKVLLGAMFFCGLGMVACSVGATISTYEYHQYSLTAFFGVLTCLALASTIGVAKLWLMEK